MIGVYLEIVMRTHLAAEQEEELPTTKAQPHGENWVSCCMKYLYALRRLRYMRRRPLILMVLCHVLYYAKPLFDFHAVSACTGL